MLWLPDAPALACARVLEYRTGSASPSLAPRMNDSLPTSPMGGFFLRQRIRPRLLAHFSSNGGLLSGVMFSWLLGKRRLPGQQGQYRTLPEAMSSIHPDPHAPLEANHQT